MRLRTALPALMAIAGLAVLTTACSSDSKSAATTAAPTTAAPTTVAATTAATTAETTAATTADTTAASTGDTTAASTGDTTAASTADTTAASTAGSTAGSGAPAGGMTVDISNFKFGPAEIDVKVGDTITWTNSDKQAHTATASGTFDTGSIAPGASATATFDKAGTYAYICSFHPFMKGTVVVS